jgi:hypothetical protein
MEHPEKMERIVPPANELAFTAYSVKEQQNVAPQKDLVHSTVANNSILITRHCILNLEERLVSLEHSVHITAYDFERDSVIARHATTAPVKGSLLKSTTNQRFPEINMMPFSMSQIHKSRSSFNEATGQRLSTFNYVDKSSSVSATIEKDEACLNRYNSPSSVF